MRLNQSIEAFVYCILGAQVNVRSPILGSLGSTKEAQHDFTQSMVGYNNSLEKATAEMKLGINKSVNLEMKSSKINRPTSQAFGLATEQQAPRGQASRGALQMNLIQLQQTLR